MLTVRQNLLETIHGGNPDRYVNQFEPFKLVRLNPYTNRFPRAQYGKGPIVNGWGVTEEWKVGTPGDFPIHTPDKIVCPDITNWRETVHGPKVDYIAEEWEPFIEAAEKIDRNEYFVTQTVLPGVFEMLHYLQEITNCLVNFYEEPEATQELIDYITEWELQYAEVLCKYIKPDALFHHDDWGTQISTFIAPDMFEEFILPSYKKIYGYYKQHGVEVIVHHCDCYARTLVPYMIDMGIDIWQGAIDTNDIPSVIKEYGGQITVMGGINSAYVDRPDYTPELAERVVREVCEQCGNKFFIPDLTIGRDASTYPGVYEKVSEEIDKMSKIMFA